MKNNYDPIAKYYDVLSRIIYFRSQVNAQIAQLRHIPSDSRILILGGGTGWILDELARIHPAGLHITYVEISEKMLELSRKRKIRDNHVDYVHCAAENFQSRESFDVVLTAFFFDNFPEEKAGLLFHKFELLLRPAGLWLFADFYYTGASGKFWQAFLLKTMYLFFRRITNVEASALINLEPLFEKEHYLPLQTEFYYRGFIKATVYRKR